MGREPDWCSMGYHSGGYGAECRMCNTVVELEFGEDEEKLLTITCQHEVDQDELFAYVFFWTLEKLRRECSCTKEERRSFWSAYDTPFTERLK